MTISMAKPQIGEEEVKAVEDVLRSGIIAQGPRVKEFETEFAKYIGSDYAVAASNGTTALHTALLAAGIGPGDEVITTPFSFVASSNSILYCGAKPVFADIGEGFNIDAGKIEDAITPKTKAVLAVHLYGLPCDVDEIINACNSHGLILVEDACQAHGAEYNSRKVGSFGIGCFSFYPTKNMTTTEGGMITTSDAAINERARIIRDHGSRQRYYHETLGFNYRMTDVSAAIGLCQLKKLDGFNEKRIKNAARLSNGLGGIDGIIAPKAGLGKKHVFHQYTIRVTEQFPLSRDELQKKLAEKQVGTSIFYPLPIYNQELYKKLGYDNVSCPNAEKFSKQVLSLPVHPGLAEADLDFIIQSIKEIAEAGK